MPSADNTFSTVISITCWVKLVCYLGLVLSLHAEQTLLQAWLILPYSFGLQAPALLLEEGSSTNEPALKVNSFRLQTVKVGRGCSTSPPWKMLFSSCPAISYRSRSMQLCTKWHSNAQGQRWHLRELQLLWNRLKWLPWIASREKGYCCHPHSQTEKKASLSV